MSGNTLDHSEVEMLAKLVESECSICSMKEKMLVASVVVNRAEAYGKSIRSTVTDPGQFYYDDVLVPSRSSYEAARRVITKGPTDDNILYFYNPSSYTDTNFVNKVTVLIYGSNHNFGIIQ